MRRASKLSPVLRAVGVISMVAVLVTGVTFAALQSSATISGNSISSATAGLVVDGSDEGAVYSTNETGFSFTDLVPGGESSNGTFKLKNEGGVDLDVKVGVTPVTTTTGIDKNLVMIKFINTDQEPDAEVEYSLAQLEALGGVGVPGVSGPGVVPGPGSLEKNELETFSIQVRLEEGAVTDNTSSISNFDLVFTGTNDAEVDES